MLFSKKNTNPMYPNDCLKKMKGKIKYRNFKNNQIIENEGSMSPFFFRKDPSDEFGKPQPQPHPWIFERRKRLTQQQPNQGFSLFGQNQGVFGSPKQKVSGVRQKINKIVKIIWKDVCDNHTSSFCFKEDENRKILENFALRYAQLKDIPIELKAILYLVQSWDVLGDPKTTFIETIKNVDLANKNPAVKRVLTDYFDTKIGEIMAKEKGKTLQQPMRMVTQTREMDAAKKELNERQEEVDKLSKKDKKYIKTGSYKTAMENIEEIKNKIANLENNFDYIPLQNGNPKGNLKINNRPKFPLFSIK